jgi:hypothetical protein
MLAYSLSFEPASTVTNLQTVAVAEGVALPAGFFYPR